MIKRRMVFLRYFLSNCPERPCPEDDLHPFWMYSEVYAKLEEDLNRLHGSHGSSTIEDHPRSPMPATSVSEEPPVLRGGIPAGAESDDDDRDIADAFGDLDPLWPAEERARRWAPITPPASSATRGDSYGDPSGILDLTRVPAGVPTVPAKTFSGKLSKKNKPTGFGLLLLDVRAQAQCTLAVAADAIDNYWPSPEFRHLRAEYNEAAQSVMCQIQKYRKDTPYFILGAPKCILDHICQDHGSWPSRAYSQMRSDQALGISTGLSDIDHFMDILDNDCPQ